MDGASGLVATQLAHLQSLEDDPLAAESCVAVQEKWQYREVLFPYHVLFCPGDSLENGIHCLKVRRVGCDGGFDGGSVIGDKLAFRAQVIFDVAGSGDINGACELVENLSVVLADDV